jgi:hypothetical protein
LAVSHCCKTANMANPAEKKLGQMGFICVQLLPSGRSDDQGTILYSLPS